MDCKVERNKALCTCTYPGCSRHALCCDCLLYHRSKRQLPGCMFPPDVEASWDRSFETFARLVREGRV
jgi:hypothetical protein